MPKGYSTSHDFRRMQGYFLFQETIPILAEDIFAILGDKQSVEIFGAASIGLLSSNGISNQTSS
jgi:hypothetical protein